MGLLHEPDLVERHPGGGIDVLFDRFGVPGEDDPEASPPPYHPRGYLV